MPGGRPAHQDRRHIGAGLAEGLGYAEIARRIDRPTSTVSREVSRNGGPGGYRVDHAHLATVLSVLSVLSVLRENARRAGRHREALGHGRRALTLAEQAGRPTGTAFERASLAELHLLLGEAHLLFGEAEEAEQLAGAAVGLAEPFGGTVLAFALTALARVRTAADPDRAHVLLDRAERCAAEDGHRQAVDEMRAARAEPAARAG
ncbi:helix-turn-helix domain-containing protein [Streptomyces sp. NPDC032198]|uniref:helix-turn-helix domain-containing protein n=1 Tax=Streptomyces sp. NPDC032198 TaxID=3155127 RepID=UPI0033F5F979